MMCFELTRLFCLNEWMKRMEQIKQPRIGGSEDSIYTFEPKVIALFGDTEEKAKKIKDFPIFFLFSLNEFRGVCVIKLNKCLVWF